VSVTALALLDCLISFLLPFCSSKKKKDGPVLTQTDLYLLKPELELHPILQQKHPTFHLLLNISTGMHASSSFQMINISSSLSPTFCDFKMIKTERERN